MSVSMRKSGREEFISTIRTVLGRAPDFDPSSREDLFVGKGAQSGKRDLGRIKSRGKADLLALLKILIEEGKALNIPVCPVADEAETARGIARLVADKDPEWGDDVGVAAWDNPVIRAMDLEAVLAPLKVPVHFTRLRAPGAGEASLQEQRAAIQGQVTQSYIGITTADYCIADTATLVMKERPGEPRSVSLVPSIHVGVVRLDRIVANLAELYTVLKYDEGHGREWMGNVLTMISGPSKTGDIELVMVPGAHGPRELHLFVMTEV